METHILIPRNFYLGQVSKTRVVLNLLLSNKVKTNLNSRVIYHMIEFQRNGNVWLPYGHLIMKILEYIGFNLEEEKSMEMGMCGYRMVI